MLQIGITDVILGDLSLRRRRLHILRVQLLRVLWLVELHGAILMDLVKDLRQLVSLIVHVMGQWHINHRIYRVDMPVEVRRVVVRLLLVGQRVDLVELGFHFQDVLSIVQIL
jgi:hypothetical protein